MDHPFPTEDMTACIVADASELHYLRRWAERWEGPISLIITTPFEPTSASYNSLASRISRLRSPRFFSVQNIVHGLSSFRSSPTSDRRTPTPLDNLSIHLLHMPSQLNTTIKPQTNALLNLARFYSNTKTTVLFPMGLSIQPRSNLRADIITSATDYPRIITQHSQKDKDLFLTTSSASWSPKRNPSANRIPRDGALVIKRDDPFWCTERFFTNTSPGQSSDLMPVSAKDVSGLWEWKECLWHISLLHPRATRTRQSPGNDPPNFESDSNTGDRLDEIIWGDPESGALERWPDDGLEFDQGGPGSDIHVRVVFLCTQRP